MCTLTNVNMKSGMYRCPDSIDNFKISVKLKKLRSTIPSANEDIDLNNAENETKTFSWQGKVFSRAEAEFYSSENNCVTDLEKHFHEMCKNKEFPDGRLFTYIDAENFCPSEETVTTEIAPKMTELCKEMSNLRQRKVPKDTSKTINVGYEINKCLNNSIANPFTVNSYETMYVMADLGNRDGDTNIWLKSEHVLCCIKYDLDNHILWIYPDFSGENQAYTIELGTDGKVFYKYSIKNVSNSKNFKLVESEHNILQKINKRNQEIKSQILGEHFSFPKRNILRVYLFFEILTAKNFEYDNLYIQYCIDLPENWSSNDENLLYGTTQTSKTIGENSHANFGHQFEIYLDYNMQENDDFPKSPFIYFQVFSRDLWERHRTEGITYKCIPVFNPGLHTFQLQCLRICPKHPSGNLRRYFIGDYSNIDDITWAGIPKDYEGDTINKFGVLTVGTGTIDIRLNVLNQSKSFKRSTSHDTNDEQQNVILERVSATSLVKSVTEVIAAFRRAREKMILARKQFVEEK